MPTKKKFIDLLRTNVRTNMFISINLGSLKNLIL